MAELKPSYKLAVFLFLISTKCWKGLCNANFIYTSVSPLHTIPGEAYPITSTLERVDHPPVTFKYELVNNERNETLVISEEITLSEPGRKITNLSINSELLVKDDNDNDGGSYNLTVTVRDSSPDGGFVEQDTILLKRNPKQSSILIQTDKPIYKPGETVKLRVFILDRFLLPFGENRQVNITVSDSEGNVIKLWKSKVVSGGKGLLSEEFELSKEPNLGEWRILVKTISNGRGETNHKSFSVDKYILPKFKVEVIPSLPYVSSTQPKFVAEVRAIYSYGKPVNGHCSVKLEDAYNFGYYNSRSDTIPQKEGSITKTSKLEEGRGLAKIEFDVRADLGTIKNQGRTRRRDTVFNLFASCMDEASGIVGNGTGKMKMFEFPHKIELVDKPKNIIPGFPVNLTIKVSTHDNVPISDGREDALKIEHGFSFLGNRTILKSIPANGLVRLSFMASPNPKVCYDKLDVTYMDLTDNFQLPGKFISPSGSYMRLEQLTKAPVEGQPLEVKVKTSREQYQAMNVFLISRGVVIHSERILGTVDTEQVVRVMLPPKSFPKVKLFIYLVFSDDNIVSDGMEVEVKPEKKNRLEVSLSETSSEPGANISISVKGHPNSTVGLRAVDQSVFLLKEDDDGLTMKRLSELVDSFQSNDYFNRGETFKDFGLALLTNVKIDKDQLQSYGYGWGSYHSPGSYSNGAVSPKVRSHFPETWIWEDLDNPEGQLTLQKRVPDTITSWQLTAFQIHPEHGLSVLEEPQKVTVFRPFFISLNLPYSVVKGEVLFLQVLVHNYQEGPVTAKVTLEDQDGDSFKLQEEEDTLDFDKMDKLVEVNGSSISTVTFPIVPSKFGIITILVKAVTNDAGDAVRRTLIVRPPGIKHTQNSAILINLLSDGVFKQEKIAAVFPEQRVSGADFLKVQVVGDVLGGTIQNLDKLIRLPTGCGEQNMLHFLPDVVILDYLGAIGQLTPEVEARAKRYLERGYQQQLTYLREDGSYSAFGKADKVGSTWLTAFVTRAFIQARKYVLVDDEVIRKSLRFLLRQQKSNGRFKRKGFHLKSLQGGAAGSGSKSSDLAITAYTLLTIAEAQKSHFDLASFNSKNKTAEKIISSGVGYLINQTESSDKIILKKDAFSLNLITYLLHYIDHPKKDNYFKIIEDLARVDPTKGTIHWKQIGSRKKSRSKITPATVEMSSYALLTYLLRGPDKLSDSVSIAKWLMKQRNPEGGFHSTQDTILGVTALAKFAEAVNTKENSEGEVTIKLSYDRDDNYHNFYIGKDNRTLLQEYLLPPSQNTTEVTIEAHGKGLALAQLTWTYYVQAVDSSPAFDLKTKLDHAHSPSYAQGAVLSMKIQFSYNRPGRSSNMAILEVNAPSGYSFSQEDLETLLVRWIMKKKEKGNFFKRYELEDQDSKLQLYFPSVDNRPITLKLKAYRQYHVSKHAPGVIKVYDYYDNTQGAQELYEVPVPANMSMCNGNDDDVDVCTAPSKITKKPHNY